MLSLLGLSLLVDRHQPQHLSHLPKRTQVLRCHANLFFTRRHLSQTHTLVIVTRSIDKNLCYNVRMGPRSYSHVCLLSHPSTVLSRLLQLLACPRHGDGALPYMANASSSIVVELGFPTVEHSSGQQPFSRVFLRPAGRDIVAPSFNTPSLGRGFTKAVGIEDLAT